MTVTVLHPGPSDAEIARISRLVASFVEGVPPIFRLEALASRDWVCVAVEDELTGSAARQVAVACADAEFTKAESIDIPWEQRLTPIVPRLHDMTASDLESLRWDHFIGSCYVTIETMGRFAIATDGDAYWMLAGPLAFVEAAIGCPIAIQVERFQQVVAAYSRDPASILGARLSTVLSVVTTTTHGK